MDRPVTSKARGTCRYYGEPRGCFAGDKCKFLHADREPSAGEVTKPVLTPYDMAKRCKFYAKGFCRRGDGCWFLHVVDSGPDESEEHDEICSVCFEKPVTFGLLSGCNHVFCLDCIRQWRDLVGKGGDVVDSSNTKKCPMCRASSRFITPSSRFWKEGQKGKDLAVKLYKESMGRVPCKHFQKSKTTNPAKPICPFGKECFYLHRNDDGSRAESGGGGGTYDDELDDTTLVDSAKFQNALVAIMIEPDRLDIFVDTSVGIDASDSLGGGRYVRGRSRTNGDGGGSRSIDEGP